MTWEQRENIFAREVITIEDIQELYKLTHTAAGQFLRNIKRKLRIDGNELVFDAPGRLHRNDYLKWIGADTTAQYGRAEKAKEYVASSFDVEEKTAEVFTYNPLINVERVDI